jgi:hypothetical protein
MLVGYVNLALWCLSIAAVYQPQDILPSFLPSPQRKLTQPQQHRLSPARQTRCTKFVLGSQMELERMQLKESIRALRAELEAGEAAATVAATAAAAALSAKASELAATQAELDRTAVALQVPRPAKSLPSCPWKPCVGPNC